MNSQLLPPPELESIVGNERQDFFVKAKREQPRKNGMGLILFGSIWMAFTSVFIVVFFGPAFLGQETTIEINGVPTLIRPDNLQPLLIPAIMLGVFELIGVGMLIGGLSGFWKQGGRFVGTPTRLIMWKKGVTRSIGREELSSDITVTGDNQEGTIFLAYKNNIMEKITQNRGSLPSLISQRYTHSSQNTISLVSIPDAVTVAEMCRKRIKESGEKNNTNFTL